MQEEKQFDSCASNVCLKFKTPRQAKEFANVKPKLIDIVLDLACIIKSKYDVDLTITEVDRSQEEQDAIYLNHPDQKIRKAYKEKPWQSTHQYHRAIDARVDFPRQHLNYIRDYLNQIYPYDLKRPKKKTAIAHDVGLGFHLHLQVMED